jgi:hypothetical protein
LRKNDGKLPFHKFSTDDIGIIKTTDEKSTYYLGKLRNSGNNYIRMIDTYGLALVGVRRKMKTIEHHSPLLNKFQNLKLALVGVKRWEQQRGSTLLSVLLAFLNYIDQWKFKYIAKGQQSNNKDADPVSG